MAGRIERRLAAIVAADVAGYSRLMGLDEVGTARALREHRAVSDALVTKHGGRIVKTTGDGLLLEFFSVVDAVECAIAVQSTMAERNQTVPADRRMQFRIGINLGDILIEGDDILGDGVNVAARLEGIAEPGGICISSSAYDQVQGKVAVEFIELGEQKLKNISRPVRAYALKAAQESMAAAPGLPILHPDAQNALSLPDKPSIAVLPFQNMSGDPEQEYFADGIVEDIITALSRFKSLFVIARNSSFAYKDKAIDIKRVGQELGVRYVLEGSVRKSGSRVRITGQLIEASTQAHLWADKFDGALAEVFDLQDSITEKIVAALVPKVRKAEIDRAEGGRTDNLDAYDTVLRAMALLRNQDPRLLPEAMAHLRRAIHLAPNYAAAYGYLSLSYAHLRIAGNNVDLEEDQRQALHFARRALELGEDDPEILVQASIAFGNYGDGERAFALAERAVDLNPNLSGGWFMIGSIYLYTGQYEKALECQARALRLSPIGTGRPGVMASISLAHFLSDRYEEAYQWADRAYQANPSHPFVHRALALSAAMAGKRTRAYEAYQRFASSAPAFLERTRMFMAGNKDFAKVEQALQLASTPE